MYTKELSKREIEVLYYSYFNHEDLAKILNIAGSTVKNHRHNIMKKLKCNNMTQALIIAIKNKIIDVNKIIL